MPLKTRELADLISVGPAMLRDFELLGIRSVSQLAKQDPQRMYARMEHATGQRQEIASLSNGDGMIRDAMRRGKQFRMSGKVLGV